MKNSGQICKQPEDLYRDRQENLVLPPDTPMKKGECGTSSCEKKARRLGLAKLPGNASKERIFLRPMIL